MTKLLRITRNGPVEQAPDAAPDPDRTRTEAHRGISRLEAPTPFHDSAAMKFTELNHIALHVADVETSCEFYERVLKLEKISRPAFAFPGAWYRLGERQELHLIGERDLPVHSHSRGTHWALMVDDMDEWEAHLTEIGQAYLPRRVRPDKAYQIYVEDPDGHMIEFCTPPGAAVA